MSNRGKPTPKPASPAGSGSAPQRPQTLKRRISSSFNTFMAALPIRRATPQPTSAFQLSTALGEDVIIRRTTAGADLQVAQQLPVIRVQVPSLSEPSQSCPYDSSNYHSFPSVERSRCSFCGMRPSKSPSSEPCNECRSHSAFSHMRLTCGKKTGVKARKEVDVPSLSFPQHSPSPEEGPRIVPPDIAAKRIGNPPRRAAMPVLRPGAVNNSMEPPLDQRSPQSLGRRTTTVSANIPHRRKSALELNDGRLISPKLHYHHGLPNSKDYPYVLKSEVPRHLDAIRAGEPSPLIDFAYAARLKQASDGTTDFSETVFYGQKFLAAFAAIPEQRRPLHSRRSTLDFEVYLDRGGHVVIERPRPEQQAGIDALLYGSNEHSGRASQLSQRNSRDLRQPRNDRRPTRRTSSRAILSSNDQPPDFQEGPGDDILPTLRGGSGGGKHAHTCNCSLMLKQLLLTCHRPGHGYATDPGSDENLPPARTPNPAKIAQALRQAHGTSRLPEGISRRAASQETSRVGRPVAGSGDLTNLLLSRTASFAATRPQPRSVFSHLSTFGLTSTFALPTVSSVNRSASSTDVAVQPTTLPPPVSLRGGADSPSALQDHERLPPTLYWLAGGRGKPITTISWNTQKPEKRMSGLFGMALHGLSAGTEYRKKARTRGHVMSTGIQQNTPVVPQASEAVTKEKAESVKSGKTHSSRASSSSTNNTKSRTGQSSKSSKSGDARHEAQREILLELVPEEAAAAAPAEADPIPAVAAAVGDQPADSLEDARLVEDLQREPVGVDIQGEAPAPNENENEGQAAAEGDGEANR